jgi:hypothetical protein
MKKNHVYIVEQFSDYGWLPLVHCVAKMRKETKYWKGADRMLKEIRKAQPHITFRLRKYVSEETQ